MMANKKRFSKEKGTLGFHFMQSFKPHELTDPYKAHEIGLKWAEKLLGEKYQYVISTHVDKDHIHNHIVVNSVSLEGKKFNASKKSLYDARTFSDEVAKEYDLSIIQTKKETKTKSYKEWKEDKRGTSWKTQIKNDIDAVIPVSTSFENFMRKMQDKGYTMKQGHVKCMTFRLPNMEKSVRGKTLGAEYTEDRIKERILYRSFSLETSRSRRYRVRNRVSKQNYRDAAFTYRYKRGTLAVNFMLAIHLIKAISQQDASNQKFVKKNYKGDLEISKLASQLQFINEHGLRNKNDLMNEKHSVVTKISEFDRVILKANEVQQKLDLVMKSVSSYKQYKPFFDEYNSAGIKKLVLKNKISVELSLFEKSVNELKKFGVEEGKVSEFIQKHLDHKNKIYELQNRKKTLNEDLKKMNQIEKTLENISNRMHKIKKIDKKIEREKER